MRIPHFVECHPERRTAFSLLRLRSLHVVGQRWSQGAAMEHNALVHVVWSHESARATPRSLTTRRHRHAEGLRGELPTGEVVHGEAKLLGHLLNALRTGRTLPVHPLSCVTVVVASSLRLTVATRHLQEQPMHPPRCR